MASLRYVDTDVDRARWRGTANVRVIPTLQVGVEFNLEVDEIGPLVTWFLMTEAHRRPAIFLGTSSDRIGSPKGTQSYYATVAKHAPRLPVSAYVTINYSEWDDGFNMPFGVTGWVGENFSIQPMYDGQRTHLTLNYSKSYFGVSLLWVWLEEPGISISAGF